MTKIFTWIYICGTNGDYRWSNGNILQNLIGEAHRIEDRCIVVEINHVDVDRDCAGKGGVTAIVRLRHQNIVLCL